MTTKYAQLLLLLQISALFSACRGSSPPAAGPEPVTGAVPGVLDPSRSARDSWILSPIRQEHRYNAIAQTSLELAGPEGVARDSLVTAVGFSLSTTRSGERLTYSATVQSMSAQGGLRTGNPSPGARVPFAFAGRLEHGRLIIDPAPGQQPEVLSDCSNEALAAIPVVQRSLVFTPLTLRKDMSWTDSTAAVTCSGSVPATVISVRHYRVLGETNAGGSHGIVLERQDRTTSQGEGSQGQHRVNLKAEGSGTARLVIDSETGALVESTATQTSTVVIRSSGRDQRFTQLTRERITRADN